MGRSPEAKARRREKARVRSEMVRANQPPEPAEPELEPEPVPADRREPVENPGLADRRDLGELPEPQPVPEPEPEPEPVPVLAEPAPARRGPIYCCRECYAELPDARAASRWGGLCWACRPESKRGHRRPAEQYKRIWLTQ